MSEGLKEARDAGDPLASAMLSIHDLEARIHTLTQQVERAREGLREIRDYSPVWTSETTHADISLALRDIARDTLNAMEGE